MGCSRSARRRTWLPTGSAKRLANTRNPRIHRQTRAPTPDPSLHKHWLVSSVTENPFIKPKYGTEIIFSTFIKTVARRESTSGPRKNYNGCLSRASLADSGVSELGPRLTAVLSRECVKCGPLRFAKEKLPAGAVARIFEKKKTLPHSRRISRSRTASAANSFRTRRKKSTNNHHATAARVGIIRRNGRRRARCS